MPTIDELRKTRVEKLKKLQVAGLLAYPAKQTEHTRSKKPWIVSENYLRARKHL